MRRVVLLALLLACAEERRTGGTTTPMTNARIAPCTAPMCTLPCACDLTTICNEGCASCDPECGQCRGPAGCMDTADAGPADGGRPVGAIGLTVVDALQATVVGAVRAIAGERFVLASIHIVNNSTVGFPLAPMHFTMETTTGLTLPGSEVTAQHPMGCPAVATLGMGRDIACTIVFRGPDHDTASLRYAVPNGPSAVVPMMARRCTVCGGSCVDAANDREHCGGCNREVVGGTCVAGQPTCPPNLSLCGLSCVNLQSDPANCGRCGVAVGRDQRCVNEMPRCLSTSRLACGTECVDTGSDRDHCGGCNRTCAYECDEGMCGEQLFADTPQSCTTVCMGRRCLSGQFSYNGRACGTADYYVFTIRNCGEVPPAMLAAPDVPGCQLRFDQVRCLCAPP